MQTDLMHSIIPSRYGVCAVVSGSPTTQELMCSVNTRPLHKGNSPLSPRAKVTPVQGGGAVASRYSKPSRETVYSSRPVSYRKHTSNEATLCGSYCLKSRTIAMPAPMPRAMDSEVTMTLARTRPQATALLTVDFVTFVDL
jgi:hypothetical protein